MKRGLRLVALSLAALAAVVLVRTARFESRQPEVAALAPAAVEGSRAPACGGRAPLPEDPGRGGLELVGARPCLYGKGKIAHIMYRQNGSPVSLFMLPRTERAAEFVQVLGHRAVIWCANNRTFVLVARESRDEVERMASAVQASLR